MSHELETDEQGKYVVTVTVELTVDPAMVGYEIDRPDLVSDLVSQMLRLDGVERAVDISQ